MGGLPSLNALSEAEARERFLLCCGSSRWASEMAKRRPFRDENDLYSAAEEIAKTLARADWLEAFSHHPRIGGKDALRAKFAATRHWAQGEQSGAATADEKIL